jgi:inner membrane protein involved in colicin E2 resistance
MDPNRMLDLLRAMIAFSFSCLLKPVVYFGCFLSSLGLSLSLSCFLVSVQLLFFLVLNDDIYVLSKKEMKLICVSPVSSGWKPLLFSF